LTKKISLTFFDFFIFITQTYLVWPFTTLQLTDLHISCICSIWKILHFYSSFSLNPSKSVFFHALTISLLPKKHMFVIFRTDLHKMKINTELCCKRYDFLTKKTQNYRYQNYCPGWQYSNLFIWPTGIKMTTGVGLWTDIFFHMCKMSRWWGGSIILSVERGELKY
jgi:hypothetical protein